MMTYVTLLLTHFRAFTARFTDERGQDLIEYALLSGVIALALVGVGAALYTGALQDMADGIGECIDFKKATSCEPF